jgi:hypothetical protein
MLTVDSRIAGITNILLGIVAIVPLLLLSLVVVVVVVVVAEVVAVPAAGVEAEAASGMR